MVLVDSSVWLSAFGVSPASFKSRIQLEGLLDSYMACLTDSIRFEILQAVNPDHRAELLSSLNQLPCLPVKASTWNVATQIGWELQGEGIRLLQGDAIVVALALQQQIPLFTLNEHQKAVQSIRKLKLLQ